MGLIDIETMNQLKAELEALYPNVLIYGEPWAATGPDGTGIARITYKDVVKGTGIGAFNDHFRDALKGSPDGDDAGYVVNGVRRDGVKVGIAGSIDDWAANPIESINYGDKHDNLILYDKLLKTGGPGTDDAAIAKMTKLTGGILAFSQGIPFYHAGVEMLRTKGGDSNSYNAPDSVNQIEWSRKAEFAETVDFYKGVIALRKAHPVFRLRTASEVRQRLRFLEDVKLPAPETIVYSLDGKGLEGESWSRATVMINPTLNELEFPDPGPGIWKVYVMGPRASLEPFAEVSGGARIKVPSRSMALIAQE
jgi:pullulanase